MLRIPLKNKARNLRRAGGPGGGPQARIDKMRRMVTDLIRWGGDYGGDSGRFIMVVVVMVVIILEGVGFMVNIMNIL